MFASLLLLLACVPEPLSLPSEAAAAVERSGEPPLYRQLYDYAFLPQVQAKEQRVRLLIWLTEMEFNRYQLGLLGELQKKTVAEFEEVEREQAEIVAEKEPEIGAVYDRLWEGLNRGASDEELGVIGQGLSATRVREAELLELRSRSVRALFEAQKPFLENLTPEQGALFADAIFFLRHRLDPYANPGDFNALIGTIYVAGEFGVLTRPTFDPEEDHLNIGGLWSDEPEKVAGAHFPNARREAILYMVLLEPTLPEALEAALKLQKNESARDAAVPGAAPAGVPPGAAPPGAVPPNPVPGEAPPPGIPTPPAPAPPGSPAPPVP